MLLEYIRIYIVNVLSELAALTIWPKC